MRPITNWTILGCRLAVCVLIGYWSAIFIGTHLPASIRITPDVNDKLKHYGAFAGLTLLMCYCTTSNNTVKRFGTIAVVILIYAMVDEWTQRFVPRRVPSVADFLADAAGMLTIMIPYVVVHRWRLRRADGPAHRDYPNGPTESTGQSIDLESDSSSSKLHRDPPPPSVALPVSTNEVLTNEVLTNEVLTGEVPTAPFPTTANAMNVALSNASGPNPRPTTVATATRSAATSVLTGVAALAFICLGVHSVVAIEPSSAVSQTPAVDSATEPSPIGRAWFEAMDSGDMDVKIILRDSTRGNVIVRNKTDKDLLVRLPNTFAAVPVLGQGMGGMGGMGGGGMGGGGMGGGGAQAGGGGMGGGGMGGGGMGGGGMGGGGMFRIAPEKQRKLPVQIVCLEHGKSDPNPKLNYKMVPLTQFSDDPQIAVVCEKLGNGEVTQKVAQAASWHIMDKLSWMELAHKNSVESKYTGNVRWFSPVELRFAQTLVSYAASLTAAESRQMVAEDTSRPGTLGVTSQSAGVNR